MVYRPPFIKQLDGSAYAALNCTMAATAMSIIRHFKGVNPPGTARWYPTPSDLRAKTGDRSGGTNLVQADTVATRYYGANLDVEYNLPWHEFRKRILAGMGAIVQGYYTAFKGTSYDAAPGFFGNHAVYVNEVRWNEKLDRWEYLMYDPMADGRRDLPKGPMWIRESLLQKFAAELRVTTGVRVGPGKVWAAFTRDTESVTLRHGASRITKKVFYARYDNIKIRRSPSLSGYVAEVRDKGQTFVAYQKKSDGALVDGSRVWYGNADGTKWTAAKNLTSTAP